jgi:D-alanine-D-alanine ligase
VIRARPKVTVLHNAPALLPDHPDAAAESDVVEAAWAISAALCDQGFEAAALAVGPPIDVALARLRNAGPDVVVNLIEGFAGSSVLATQFTALLELTGLPITGCPSESLAFCLSKGRAKALLRGCGLPTAPDLVVSPGDPVPEWFGPWPVIVKPDSEDASLGIDQGSVVNDGVGLADRLARVRAAYGRALVEAYLPGPEYNLGMVGLPEPEALPVGEVCFLPRPDAWPILTYAAKWESGSAEDLACPVRYPARIDPELASRLGRLAVAAFRATACRDYARVDFRLDGRGEPMILEVNPNPDIGPSAGWAHALRASGRDYGATLAALARQAIRRGGTWGR